MHLYRRLWFQRRAGRRSVCAGEVLPAVQQLTDTHYCHVLAESWCYFWIFEFPERNLSDQIFMSRNFPLMHHYLKRFSLFRRVMCWGLSRSQQMNGGSLRTVKATEEWFQKPIWRYTTPHGSEFSKSKMIFSWKAMRGHFLNQLTWSFSNSTLSCS